MEGEVGVSPLSLPPGRSPGAWLVPSTHLGSWAEHYSGCWGTQATQGRDPSWLGNRPRLDPTS